MGIHMKQRNSTPNPNSPLPNPETQNADPETVIAGMGGMGGGMGGMPGMPEGMDQEQMVRAASERRGNALKGSQDFCMKANARIWP